MLDITNVTILYVDLLFSVFSVIILISALVFLPIGVWALKAVKKNIVAAVLSFGLFVLSLIAMSYSAIRLRGLLYVFVLADIFLGAVIGFLAAISVIKLRHRNNKA